jgi:cell division protein FtsB
MARTIEQQERELRELKAQVESLKQAMSLLSRRLVANERKSARVAEITRRQSDMIARLEQTLRGG